MNKIIKVYLFCLILNLEFIAFAQVRKHYMKELDKLKAEGAFISGKAVEENDRLVDEIFKAEDANKDGKITWFEFSKTPPNPKNHVEL